MAIDVRQQAEHALGPVHAHVIQDVHQATCCVAGGGPAGVLLTLLLARQGIPTTLLEAHADFDRDFRGDTVHPAIMTILDQIGLAERLLETVPHTRVRRIVPPAVGQTSLVIDFGQPGGRFPYMTLMRQMEFLEFLVAEARRYAAFQLVMGATVRELVEDDGVVRGVRYQAADGWHEVRALLTVGADGRFQQGPRPDHARTHRSLAAGVRVAQGKLSAGPCRRPGGIPGDDRGDQALARRSRG